jgi:hypothetical protein
MFDHVELVIPPTNHVRSDVDAVMRHVMTRRHPWCDFYYIGGRWNGLKVVIDLDLEPFDRRLDEMQVRVSYVDWNGNRQSLRPESQAEAIDLEWRRLYPGRGDYCPLFAQYKGPPDINWCPVGGLSDTIRATRLVVAKPTGRRKIIHVLTEDDLRPFDNKVKVAIRSLQKLTPESPTDDWLVVTLCCHW